MKKLTKQEQKAEAWKAYLAIADPAWKAYEAVRDPAWRAYDARCEEIEEQEEE